MQTFAEIHERAAERKGGEGPLRALLPKLRSARSLGATGDDRWLAQMTRCVFQAGFVYRVVNAKWDDFETVFTALKKQPVHDPGKPMAVDYDAQFLVPNAWFLCYFLRQFNSR